MYHTNLPALVVALSVVWKSCLNPLVYFPQSHALLRGAGNRHADQLHVGIRRTFLQPVSLALCIVHTMLTITKSQTTLTYLN